MDVDSRKQAQRQFRTRAKIMVATDAAGEGINLQFCRYLINWDIPWNPNRLEQRMGRIHRYGQTGDVWVYNSGRPEHPRGRGSAEGSLEAGRHAGADGVRPGLRRDRRVAGGRAAGAADRERHRQRRRVRRGQGNGRRPRGGLEREGGAAHGPPEEDLSRLAAGFDGRRASYATHRTSAGCSPFSSSGSSSGRGRLAAARSARTTTSRSGTSARRRPPFSNSPASAGSLCPSPTTPPSSSTSSSSASRARCASRSAPSSWAPDIPCSTP
ncbi:MAG: hypothetical protein KatS3mg131_0254 [Candidatus Tectimicrobiota bacterium]|nr:MAG: hypothetical protein KatS3mg131_0254 [Candidatus Tectomicrobia bacterium]